MHGKPGSPVHVGFGGFTGRARRRMAPTRLEYWAFQPCCLAFINVKDRL